MKNKVLLLLAVTYLFSALGVSAKSMYCMGVLRSTTISYGTQPKPKKADCKMADRMKNCCKTKKQLLKVKDQHVYAGAIDLLAKFFPVLFNFTNDNAPTCAAVIQHQQSSYGHVPPTVPKIPVYMLNCNYRI